jgi:hypothetical protein
LFSLAVMIDTGENSVAAVDVTLTFDQNLFEVSDSGVQAGSLFPTPAMTPDTSIPGKVRFSYYTQPAQQTASGLVATVNFKALEAAVGSGTIDFSAATKAGGIDEIGSVIKNTLPATVAIAAGSEPTATPTPEPTATPTPGAGEPTATPTPEADPTATPTPDDNGGDDATTLTATDTPTSAPVPTTASIGPTAILMTGGAGLLLLGLMAVFLI